MPAPFAHLAPRRRLLLRALTAAALLAVLALVGAAVTRTLTSAAPGAAPQDQPGPVLLVPGYGGSTAALSALAARLEAAGRQTVLVTLPGDGTGDLRAAADVLAAEVDAAVAAGAPSVDVVGFSAGGVTTRLYAARRADLLRRVVTLGSPHHGTGVAGLASALAPESCSEACRQLVPGSGLLTGLNAGDETPEGPLWLTVWTTQDEVVTPPASARLDGAVEVALQEVCPDAVVAHGDLPRDALTAGIVLTALGEGVPREPAPASCRALRALGAG